MNAEISIIILAALAAILIVGGVFLLAGTGLAMIAGGVCLGSAARFIAKGVAAHG